MVDLLGGNATGGGRAKPWAGVSTRNLILAVGVLLALLVQPLWEARQGQLLLDQLQSVQHLGEKTVDIGRLVHAIQTERGRSAVFVAGREAEAGREMQAQRVVTDRAMQEMQTSLQELAAMHCVYQETFLGMLQDWARLGGWLTEVRALVDQEACPSQELINRYDQIVEGWLQVVEALTRLGPKAEIVRRAMSYLGILWAKEWSGRERAVVSTFFFQDPATSNLYHKFVAMEEVRRAHLEIFTTFASLAHRQHWQELQRHAVASELTRRRDTLLHPHNGSSLPGGVREWFTLSSQWIDQLQVLERRVGQDLLDYMREEAAAERRTLWAHWAVNGAIIAAALAVLWLLLSRLASEWRRLRQSQEQASLSLQESALHLTHAEQLSPMASWRWDGREAGAWVVSEQFRRLLGMAEAEPVTLAAYLKRMPAAERERVGDYLRRAWSGQACGTLEHAVLGHAASERRTLLVCVALQRLAEGGEPRLLGTLVDITERKALEERLRHQAHHDALTGLPNRVLFQEFLGKELARAERQGSGVGVVYLDLDGFKPVNDTLGHEAGDRVLVAVAKRLLAGVRAMDTVARLGGDEFAILLPDSGLQEAEVVAMDLLEKFNTPFEEGDTRWPLGVSIGVALYPVHGVSGEVLLARADQAMYAVKMTGKHNFRYYAPDLPEKGTPPASAG